MRPDLEQQLKDRLEQAPLDELIPGFDSEAEWGELSQRLHKRWRFAFSWSYAAAMLLLLAGSGFLAWYLMKAPGQQVVVQNNIPSPPANNTIAANTDHAADPVTATVNSNDTAIKRPGNNTVVVKKRVPPTVVYVPVKNYQAKDIICNGTPCPIQICITQTMKCPDSQPKPISTCATLESDQSATLNYKEHNEVAKNCSLTINEIEIKSVATGETILLNATSTPYTAQDVFSYITGEKKGDILAGVLHHDCNKQNKKKGLRLDNSYGDIIIRQ